MSSALRAPLEPTLPSSLAGLSWAPPCLECAPARELVDVNTVRFDVLDGPRLVQAFDRFVACGGSHVVHFLAAHPTVAARENAEYRDLLNSGDYVVPDGTPIALVMRAKNASARRLTSTDAFVRVCQAGCDKRLRHYFVGGANDDVATAFEAELRRRYPSIQVAGFTVPPFRPYSDEEVAELSREIRASGADAVWVGLGAPKQDLLAHRLRLHGAAPVIACIGATFDFVAGTKRRAPQAMRSLGLEWVYRLATEPRRLGRRYLIGNTRFVLGVCSDSLGRGGI
jgi:N-acetylglucosaminyldiphosphoundecaprenol N-acetyl-beta-D-mannosaminyltransferase